MVFKDNTTNQSMSLPLFHDFCIAAEHIIKNNSNVEYVICRTNILNFRLFNELYGIETGDKLLIGISNGLSSFVSTKQDFIAGYINNDQFVFLAPLVKVKANEEKIYEWFTNLTQSVLKTINIQVNLGFVEVESNRLVERCCDDALLAIRSIKDDYSKHYAWYDSKMKQKYLEYSIITNAMHEALKNNEFIPYFQPQYDYETGELIGTEALVRWNSPKGLISTNKFIPVFEQNGFINELDTYILNKVCEYIRKWKDEGLNVPSISINISRRDMYSSTLIKTITDTIKKYNLEPKNIHIEITESAYMENKQINDEIIRNLKNKGFCVEMDDFGSGYSSLLALKDFPFDVVKLDMGFLQETEEIGKSGKVLTSIVKLAHQMDLPVIAEGVEEKRQADFLKSIGCHLMQGFLFSKPLSSEDYHELLKNRSDEEYPKNNFVDIVDKSVDFLDVRTQEALLFNNFVGGALILEYRDKQLEILRTNDNFFYEINVPKKVWDKTDLFKILKKDEFNKFLKMLDEAIESSSEQGNTFYTNEFGQDLWIKVRVRCLAKKVHSFIFYCDVENVTEQQLLYRKNQELNRTLSSVVNNVPCGIIKCKYENKKLKVTFISEGYYTMRGYQKEELKEILNQDISACVHPQDKEKLKEALKECIKSGHGFEMTYRVLHKDGHYIWIKLRTSYDLEENFLYSYCSDITKDVMLKTNLDLSQSKLANLGNSMYDGTALYEFIDGKPEIVEISNGILELSGYSLEEYKEKFKENPMFSVFKTDIPRVEKIFKEPESADTQTIEFRTYTKDNSLIWVNRQSKFIDRDDKRMLFCTYRNLSVYSSLYQTILNETDNGIIVYDANDYEILFVNERTREIYELNNDELLGKKAQDVFFDFEDFNKIEVDKEEDYKGHHYYTVRKPIKWNNMDAYIIYVTDYTDSYNAKLRAQNIVTNLPVGFAVYKLIDNKLTDPYFSKETVNILDYDETEDNHDSITQRINQEDLTKVKDVIKEAKKNFKSFESEFRMKCKDGSIRWIRVIGKPFYEEIDDEKEFLISYTNVTKFKEQEELIGLSQQETIIANSLSKMGRVICYYDIKNKVLTCPESYAERHGIKTIMYNYPGDYIFSHLAQSKEDKDFFKFYNDMANGVPKGYLETIFVLSNGKLAYETAEYVTVFDKNGEPKIAVIAVEDASRVHRAEVKFEEMKRKILKKGSSD